MKSKFFVLAMAVCVALVNVACGDDDEKSSDGQKTEKVTLKTPKYDSEAVSLQIQNPDGVNTSNPDAPRLVSIDITGSGDVFFGLEETKDGKSKVTYATSKVLSAKDRVYMLENGRLEYTAETRGATRANVSVGLNFEFNISGTTYSTSDVVFAMLLGSLSTGDLTTFLCRQWTVQGMLLVLKPQGGGTGATTSYNDGNFASVRGELVEHGVNLTEKEKAEFERNLASVNVTKAGNIYLNYRNGTPATESFTWNWLQQNATDGKLNFKVNDSESANKFFNEASSVTVAFSGNNCNLSFTTKLQGDKDYDTTLTLQLKAQD